MPNKLTVKPLGNRVICSPAEVQKKSAGGIFLMGGDKNPRGKVLAVGPDCVVLKKGQNVVWDEMSGVEMEEDGFKFHLLSETDIICVVQS